MLALLLQPARAELRFEQVRALPPLPAAFTEEASPQRRIDWLRLRLAQPLDEAERYRGHRLLFNEFFFAHRNGEAATQCREHPPLKDDLVYRMNCILASAPGYDEHLPKLLALADEARQLDRPAAAALVLKELAWRQSQAGDIAAAFESFEAALAQVPAGESELVTDLMMDTAASYIVNGDESFIRKGIALLERAREQLERALADPNGTGDRTLLQQTIQLTEFNRGIAHVLHLGSYAQGLQHFARVVAEPGPYLEDALVFAALAASELGRFDTARAYLERAARLPAGEGDPVVRQYLRCYRQLAQRRWQPGQALGDCLALKPETTTEVLLDVYRRLVRSGDPAAELAGLRGLKTLFDERLEPQLRRRGSTAASRTELRRLERESELKSVVLQQQAELQRARDATNAQRQTSFIALTALLLSVVLLVGLQWRAKKKLAEQFEALSLVDTLTQLGNRRYLNQHISRELALLQRARRRNPQASLGVYLFDLDHFKSINDRLGHGAGDEVLVTVAQRLQAVTRDSDLLVRWGGEEFLLVARLDDPERCTQIADRLLQAVGGSPIELSAHGPLPVSCTIGVLRLPWFADAPAPSWTDLVDLADLALYEGKLKGRNRWVLVENQGLADGEALAAALQRPLADSVAAGHLRLLSSTDPDPAAAPADPQSPSA